jgi:hypothetical protein
VLALTDPRDDLIVTALSDEQKIKELNERLPSMDRASAPRIRINSRQVALVDEDGRAAFDALWTK